MGFKTSSILCLALFLAISSSIRALDITKLLGQHPEFAAFGKYLTETKLIDEINKRNTITILAVNDAGVSALSGKSQQAIKAILSTHVILDYFDEKKLVEAQGSGQLLTTLYQSSGLAVNQQGFIKVALVGEGEIAFGSAVKDAPADVNLMRTVVSQPYNISIFQVTKFITIPGVDSQTPGAPSNAQAPAQSAKGQSETAKAPVASAKAPVTSAKAPVASAKAPVASAKAPVSADAPTGASADAPTGAPTGASADAPTGAPTGASADAPTGASADAPTGASANGPTAGAQSPSPSGASVADSPADAPTTIASTPSLAPGPADGAAADAATPSSSSRTMIGLVGAFMCFASLLIAM